MQDVGSTAPSWGRNVFAHSHLRGLSSPPLRPKQVKLGYCL